MAEDLGRVAGIDPPCQQLGGGEVPEGVQVDLSHSQLSTHPVNGRGEAVGVDRQAGVGEGEDHKAVGRQLDPGGSGPVLAAVTPLPEELDPRRAPVRTASTTSIPHRSLSARARASSALTSVGVGTCRLAGPNSGGWARAAGFCSSHPHRTAWPRAADSTAWCWRMLVALSGPARPSPVVSVR